MILINMAHYVTLLCRIDSLNDKQHLDKQVSTVLKSFKKNFKGRKSQLTEDSDLERKYVFHQLDLVNALKLKALATENKAQLCMKTVLLDSETTRAPTAPTPSSKSSVSSSPRSSRLAVANLRHGSPTPPSISSSTESLVLNFGLDSPAPASNASSSFAASLHSKDSFFSSASVSGSRSSSSSSSSFSGSDVGVGTPVTTPEILLLRELADIMQTSSKKKPTPSQIGKAVSAWFVADKVQNVLRRIV